MKKQFYISASKLYGTTGRNLARKLKAAEVLLSDLIFYLRLNHVVL